MTAQPLETAPVKPDPLWEKRLQLAKELDAQGIYPPSWTEAQRAPWRDQEDFRQTGTYDTDRHFLAAGQLYDRAHPALAPSRAQAEESLKAYVGEPRKPLAETIPVHEVPLRHPVGQPYLPISKADAEEKAKLLARQNVNHLTWHDGDALPSHLDQWIKTNGYKTSDIYQGPDGHHYRHNEVTRTEAPDVVALRLKHSGEQTMREIADGPDPAEPHVVGHIAEDWLKEARMEQRALNAHKAQTETPAPTTPASDTPGPANDNKPTAASPSIPETVAQKVRETASALDKLKADAALSPSEFQTLSDLQNQMNQAGFKIDLRKIDTKALMPAAEKLANITALNAEGGLTPTGSHPNPLLAGTALSATSKLAIPTTGELAEGLGALAATIGVDTALAAGYIILAPVVIAGLATRGSHPTIPPRATGFLPPELTYRDENGVVRIRPRVMTAPEKLNPPIPIPKPLKPIEAGKPDLGGNPVPQIPLIPEQLPIPDYVKPLIDVIPIAPGTFIKPTIIPGWDAQPEELDPNVYNRKGSEETERRAEACREAAAKIFKNAGYEIIGRWGGNEPEHYFPNASTGKPSGGSWSDAGLWMLNPLGQQVSWHLSTYTMNPKTGEAVAEEVTKAVRLIRNWIGLTNTQLPLSDKVAGRYLWFQGAFSMVAKGKKGKEYDRDFLEECERQVRGQLNADGTLRPPTDDFPDAANN